MDNLLQILIAMLIVGLVAYFFGFKRGKFKREPRITISTIENQIESVKELTTVRYYYTNVGAFENQNEFYGFKIPLTLKKFIISYDGVIGAGVNLEDMIVKIDGNKIGIDLPPAEILFHEIDEDSVKIFDERFSFFNSINLEDYTGFSKEQKRLMRKKVIDKGLLERAYNETKKAIKDILSIDENIRDNYEIIFRK